MSRAPNKKPIQGLGEIVDALTNRVASDAMRDRVLASLEAAAPPRELGVILVPDPRPRTPGPRTRIQGALARVQKEIEGIRGGEGPDNRYGRGMSREGYSGGYEQALKDVLLVLDGTVPQTRNYWREP